MATKSENKAVPVKNWPMNLDATRQALYKTHQQLDRYQRALKLATHQIKQRNQGMMAITNFVHQANQTPTPTDLLKLALAQALQIVTPPAGAQIGALVLIENETKALTLAVHKGLTPALSDILTGRQLGQGADVLMPHLTAGTGALLEKSTNDEAEQQLLAAADLSGLISLPIRLNTKLIGALLVGVQQKKYTFASAEIHFLMILCHEIAIALENLNLRDGLWQTVERLLRDDTTNIMLTDREIKTGPPAAPLDLPSGAPMLEPANDDMEHLLAGMMEAEDEVQQQNTDLQALNTVSEIINRTFNLGEILQQAVEHTQNTLQTTTAWICLLDDHGLLQIQAHTGFPLDEVQGIPHLKPDESIEGEIVTANRASFIEFLPDDDRQHKTWLNRDKFQAVALVPISRPVKENTAAPGEHVVGVLAAARPTDRPYTWTPRENRLLSAIANQLAVAIENAQLYDQVYEREVGLSWTNQMLREINDMLLEKNAYLESFVESDLPQALTEISQLLGRFQSDMPDPPRKKINQLQTILQRLEDRSQEAGYFSRALDSALDETLDDETKQNSYAGVTKPVRLHKTETTPQGTAPSPNPSPPSLPNVDSTQPMSFEDALAAGLVPAHLMMRETEDQENF